MNKRPRSRHARSGFTLLELLIATAMFAVIIVALYSAFYGALRLRERAYDTFEARLPRDYVFGVIERDLAGTLVPSGILAGAFLGEKIEEGGRRLDRLEIHTTSGIVDEGHPWGEVQRIEFAAMEPEAQEPLDERDFTRSVTRNLLASTEEEPEAQHLLPRIQSLEFAYFDGEDWQDSWDSTTRENTLPRAVRLRMEFVPDEEKDNPQRPLEWVVPIAAGSISSEAQTGPGAGAQEGGNR